MSNVYGFAFLENEHTLGDDSTAKTTADNERLTQGAILPSAEFPEEDEDEAEETHEKSDLEKQFDVLKFLKAHRSSGCIPPSIIQKSIGLDLSEGGRDDTVRTNLLNNARIKIEEIPDPENPTLIIKTFGYQAKFNNVMNRTGLLAQINESKNGVRRKDLIDSYEGVESDIDDLITGGEIIAVLDHENKKDNTLFPRGEQFLVELDGHVSVTDPSDIAGGETSGRGSGTTTNSKLIPYIAETDVNLKRQIRRGEAIWVGGQWFRVSSAIKEGVPLSEQPARAKAPLSVTSRKDLSRKNENDGYIRQFTDKIIPLDHRLTTETIANVKAARVAQAKLQKISKTNARAVTGSAGAQLLSSNASAANPESLAAAFASTASSSSRSRRNVPSGARGNQTYHVNAKKVAEQFEEAKKAALDPTLIYSHTRRHGCTLDVRDLYLATTKEIPPPENEVGLHKMMIEYKLLEPNELMKRPRMSKKNMNLGEDGRPKKRRYYERKGQRMTNTHLDGSEIGQLLRAAFDKQLQGKSVGDGGM